MSEKNNKGIEFYIGTYLFQVVGVIIVLIGMGFLFTYAIERGLIGPLARVAIGFASAAACIGVGELVKKKSWANGLIAGGIVLAYASLYAATALYGLMGLKAGLVSALVITAIAIFLSYIHDSAFIGTFGVIGALLMPNALLLGSIGHFSLTGIFLPQAQTYFSAYYFWLISTAFLCLALAKRWRIVARIVFFYGVLLFVASFFTFLLGPFSCVFPTVVIKGYSIEPVLLYLLFVLIPYGSVFIWERKDTVIETFLIGLAAPILFFSLLLWWETYAFRAVILPMHLVHGVLIILSLLYGMLAALFIGVKMRWNMILVPLLFIALWAPLGVLILQSNSMIIFLAILAFTGTAYWAAIRFKQWYLLMYSFLAVIGGPLVIMFARAELLQGAALSVDYLDVVISNGVALVQLILFSLVAYFGPLYTEATFVNKKCSIRDCGLLGVYTTILLWLSSGWLFPFPFGPIVLAVYAFVLFVLGVRYSHYYTRLFSYGCFVLPVIWFVVQKGYISLYHYTAQPLESYVTFNGLAALLGVVGVGYYVGALYNKKELLPHEFSRLQLVDEVFLVVLAFVAIGRNVYSFAQPMSAYLIIIALYYGLSALVLLGLGLVFKRRPIRYLGIACAALVINVLWLIANQIVDPLYRVALFIVVGIIFIVVSFMYQQISKRLLQ